MTFEDIVNASKTFGLGFTLDFIMHSNGNRIYSLKLSHKDAPCSIREVESEIITKMIDRYVLRDGFEIATAFGVSALTMGQACKGRLLSVDAYIEEDVQSGDPSAYRVTDNRVKYNADGYKMAANLLSHFDIRNVELEIGWSPQDIPSLVARHGFKEFDFALIDGGHSADQIIADVEVIMPFMNPKRSIFFLHDGYWVPERVWELLAVNGYNAKAAGTECDLRIAWKGL